MNELEQKKLFAKDIYKAIRNILYHNYNVDNDDLAKFMTSLIMEESGWGTRGTGTYNYFGIKARKGEPYKSVLTTENINGKELKLSQNFRNYDSLEEGLTNYVNLLVKNYDILNHGVSMDDYAHHLKLKGYATREDYPQRLSGIYNGRTFRSALKDYKVTPELKIYQFDYNSIPHWEPPIHYSIKVPYRKTGGHINNMKYYIAKISLGPSDKLDGKFKWYRKD